MSFLDRLVKQGLIRTVSGSSSNHTGAFPVTEEDLARYQNELAAARYQKELAAAQELLGRAQTRGLGSIGHSLSSSSSSSSLEDCIVRQYGVHGRRNNNVNKSVVDEPAGLAAGVVSSNNVRTKDQNNTSNKIRTSSCDDGDDLDLINGNINSCPTFDMSLLPTHEPTMWSLDEHSLARHGNANDNAIEFTLDETIMNHHHQERGGGGEDNVLLMCRITTKKPPTTTVRSKAKQVILTPLRSGWCFVKSVGERVRRCMMQREHHHRRQGASFQRRRGRKNLQQLRRRNFDPTASLDDDDDDDDEEQEEGRVRKAVRGSEEMVEFELLSSRSGGDEILSFQTSNDIYHDDGDSSSSTHSSR